MRVIYGTNLLDLIYWLNGGGGGGGEVKVAGYFSI